MLLIRQTITLLFQSLVILQWTKHLEPQILVNFFDFVTASPISNYKPRCVLYNITDVDMVKLLECISVNQYLQTIVCPIADMVNEPFEVLHLGTVGTMVSIVAPHNDIIFGALNQTSSPSPLGRRSPPQWSPLDLRRLHSP